MPFNRDYSTRKSKERTITIQIGGVGEVKIKSKGPHKGRPMDKEKINTIKKTKEQPAPSPPPETVNNAGELAQIRKANSEVAEKIALSKAIKPYKELVAKIHNSLAKLYTSASHEDKFNRDKAVNPLRGDMARSELSGVLNEMNTVVETTKNPVRKKELQAFFEKQSQITTVTPKVISEKEINTALADFYQKCEAELRPELEKIAADAFMQKTYDLQKQVGRYADSKVDSQAMQSIIDNGKYNYLDSLKHNVNMLSQKINKEVDLALSQGKSYEEVLKAVDQQILSSRGRMKNHLISGQANYLALESEAAACQAAGLDEYEYVPILDAKTEPECIAQNGKRYRFSEKEVGVNYPPLHYGCRCSVKIPEEDLEKLKTLGQPMPEEITTYEEWLAKQEGRELTEDEKLSVRLQKEGITPENAKEIMNIYKTAPPELQRCMLEAFKERGIRDPNWYMPETLGEVTAKGIRFDQEEDKINPIGKWDTFYHESGHLIDLEYGKKYGIDSMSGANEKLYAALHKDFAAEEERISRLTGRKYPHTPEGRRKLYDEMIKDNRKTYPATARGALNLYSGVTGGVLLEEVGGGHRREYWKNENALNREAFAFFTGGKVKPGSELDLMYRRKLPNAYREYEDMLKKMGSGAEPVLVDGKLKGWKEAKTSADANLESKKQNDIIKKNYTSITDAEEKEYAEKSKVAYNLLTPEQRKALYDYTDEGYKVMNGYLRTGEGSERDKRQAKVLHETLKETKVPKDMIVYRGCGNDISKTFGIKSEIFESIMQGKIPADEVLSDLLYKDDAFVSTSISSKRAFDRPVKITYKIPRGFQGFYVDPISANKGEKEMLLNSEQEFVIQKAELKDGVLMLEAEGIDNVR